MQRYRPKPSIVLACLALVLVISLSRAHYRNKALDYLVNEIPVLYPLYQAGHQDRDGTDLPFPRPANAFLALSTPKYNNSHNSRVYLLGEGNEEPVKVIAETPPLPERPDPQGIAIYRNELIIANHQGRADSVVIYDLGMAFSDTLKVIGHIPNLPSPTSVYIHKERLYVTCAGRHYMRGQGVYVYEKDKAGVWQQAQRFLYRDMFGRHIFENEYHLWPNVVPSTIVIKDDIAYLANMVSGSIMLVDLGLPPEEAYIGKITGPTSRIHYPLGMYIDADQLLIAEHMHHYIERIPMTARDGDVTPLAVFIEPRHVMNPFDLIVRNGKLYVSSLASTLSPSVAPNALFVFPQAANGIVEPVMVRLPDDASITRMVSLDDAS